MCVCKTDTCLTSRVERMCVCHEAHAPRAYMCLCVCVVPTPHRRVCVWPTLLIDERAIGQPHRTPLHVRHTHGSSCSSSENAACEQRCKHSLPHTHWGSLKTGIVATTRRNSIQLGHTAYVDRAIWTVFVLGVAVVIFWGDNCR